MRILTPELEAALDRLKAVAETSDHLAGAAALDAVLELWPAKHMPQVVTDRRVPPGETYLTHITSRVQLSHELAVRLGARWLSRPIPAGGIPVVGTGWLDGVRYMLRDRLEPRDLTLADPEE